MPAPFANATDYIDRGYSVQAWPTEEVLTMKLAEASRYLRSPRVYPTIDADIAAEILDPELVKDVVCAMVNRAAPVEGTPAGAESTQMGVDIFQRTTKFGGGGANQLYLTKEDRKKLGIGGQRAYSVDLIPEDYRIPYASS